MFPLSFMLFSASFSSGSSDRRRVSSRQIGCPCSVTKQMPVHLFLVGGGDRPPSCFVYRLYPPPKYGNPLHFPT